MTYCSSLKKKKKKCCLLVFIQSSFRSNKSADGKNKIIITQQTKLENKKK